MTELYYIGVVKRGKMDVHIMFTCIDRLLARYAGLNFNEICTAVEVHARGAAYVTLTFEGLSIYRNDILYK